MRGEGGQGFSVALDNVHTCSGGRPTQRSHVCMHIFVAASKSVPHHGATC